MIEHVSTDLNPHGLYLHSTVGVGALWWAADQVVLYGPRWELVPPLLIAGTSFLGAVSAYLSGRQLRRHREERHRVEVESSLHRGPFTPG